MMLMAKKQPVQKAFTFAADGVDPADIHSMDLYTGAKIPAIGLGTFGSDHSSNEEIAAAVIGAAEVGYRHFDCASVYGNEALIGRSFKAIMDGGLNREDLWITSKLWNNKHAPDDVIPSCQESLDDLQLDYLDLYLVHWPYPNFHPPFAPPDYHNPDAKPYIHEDYMATWAEMEKLVDMGLVKHIGTSNMTIPKLEFVLRDARIKPACNEMELHPHFQQPELFKYVVDHGLVPIGYSPIGSPNRPDRDRTPDDTVDMEDPAIVDIAERLGVHPTAVCLKWGVQHGQVVIPMSVNRAHYLANLQAIAGPPLSDEDMAAIAGIDKNCQLIKGQVFLWREDLDWHALWDESGEITPP
jgi:diketogulonate reductase-like aldo/keto reductase